MAKYYEPGNSLPIVSLGGIISKRGKGRVVEQLYYSPGGTPPLHILSVLDSRPGRIAAIIQNRSAVDVVLSFGEGDPSTSFNMVLYPNGNLQIDKDFPWIGGVKANSALQADYLTVTEIFIE